MGRHLKPVHSSGRARRTKLGAYVAANEVETTASQILSVDSAVTIY
jgi:hypothetical protein